MCFARPAKLQRLPTLDMISSAALDKDVTLCHVFSGGLRPDPRAQWGSYNVLHMFRGVVDRCWTQFEKRLEQLVARVTPYLYIYIYIYIYMYIYIYIYIYFRDKKDHLRVSWSLYLCNFGRNKFEVSLTVTPATWFISMEFATNDM